MLVVTKLKICANELTNFLCYSMTVATITYLKKFSSIPFIGNNKYIHTYLDLVHSICELCSERILKPKSFYMDNTKKIKNHLKMLVG